MKTDSAVLTELFDRELKLNRFMN